VTARDGGSGRGDGDGDGDGEAEARLIELYKLAVEMTQRVAVQRGVANAFHLTVQTAFVSVLGLSGGTLRDERGWVAGALVLVGVVLSASWWLQLRGYRELSRAKFVVIHELEKRLPAALFTDEWKALNGPGRGRHIALGEVERAVPVAFALLYPVIGLAGAAG
jgi:hypothetical protein